MAMNYTAEGPVGTVSFYAKPSTNQNNFPVGVTDVVLGTEVWDTGANFASNIFTAPVTGKYLLCGYFYIYQMDTAADYYEFRITCSNRATSGIVDPGVMASDPVYWHVAHSMVVDMDANDTARLKVQVPNGTVQMDLAQDTFFSGCLVG